MAKSTNKEGRDDTRALERAERWKLKKENQKAYRKRREAIKAGDQGVVRVGGCRFVLAAEEIDIDEQ